MGEEPGQSAWTPPFLRVSCKQMDQSPSHIHSPAVPASDTAGPETSDTTGPETLHTTTCRPVSRWDCQPLTPQLSAGETVSPLPPNCQTEQYELELFFLPSTHEAGRDRRDAGRDWHNAGWNTMLDWTGVMLGGAVAMLGGTDMWLGGTDVMLGGRN